MKELGRRPLTRHRGDAHLQVVLRVDPAGEYVVHTQNLQDGAEGYFDGFYSWDLLTALTAFMKRGTPGVGPITLVIEEEKA